MDRFIDVYRFIIAKHEKNNNLPKDDLSDSKKKNERGWKKDKGVSKSETNNIYFRLAKIII